MRFFAKNVVFYAKIGLFDLLFSMMKAVWTIMK